MIDDYDRESKILEPDYNEPEQVYDSLKPLSIFNHPPYSQMSLRDFEELERSWP